MSCSVLAETTLHQFEGLFRDVPNVVGDVINTAAYHQEAEACVQKGMPAFLHKNTRLLSPCLPPNMQACASIWDCANSDTPLSVSVLSTAAGAEAFALPLLVGYVGQFRDAVLADASGQSVSATVTLIGRMAVARSGTRLWRRGCDAQVCVFVACREKLVNMRVQV